MSSDFLKTEIFTSSINSFRLNLDLNHINNYCYLHKNNNKSVKKSNSNGFQSDFLLDNEPTVNLLKNIFVEKINLISKEIYKINNKLNISGMWFNINGHMDYNTEHEHPNSILSGVFYSKIPKDSGKIVFSSSENIGIYLTDINILEHNKDNSINFFVNPEINFLHIFPSWLKHRVEANISKEDRISFSFNTNYILL
jgi:uncharacterized protein (TIGR02466 family)